MNGFRAVLRGTGEVFITVGLLLLLFCVYQLFWTNVEAGRAQAKVTDQIENDWQHGVEPVPAGKPSTESAITKGFAIMHIPRLGPDWQRPIVEGVSLSDLHKGLGHYPDSAMPGQVGNFAVAGHRATNGEPFRNLDELRPGDKVVIETRTEWLTYTVDSPYGNSVGHEIVDPHETEVVAPVPKHPGEVATKRLMTLTTCHPRWASRWRMIVYTHLTARQAKSAGVPAALGG